MLSLSVAQFCSSACQQICILACCLCFDSVLSVLVSCLACDQAATATTRLAALCQRAKAASPRSQTPRLPVASCNAWRLPSRLKLSHSPTDGSSESNACVRAWCLVTFPPWLPSILTDEGAHTLPSRAAGASRQLLASPAAPATPPLPPPPPLLLLSRLDAA